MIGGHDCFELEGCLGELGRGDDDGDWKEFDRESHEVVGDRIGSPAADPGRLLERMKGIADSGYDKYPSYPSS